MRPWLFRLGIVSVASLLVGLPDTSGAGFADLELTVRTETSRFGQYVPICLFVTLRNPTAQTIRGNALLDGISDSYLRFSLRSPDGKEESISFRYPGMINFFTGPPAPEDMPPGWASWHRVVIPPSYVETLGAYGIRAVFRDIGGKAKVSSPEVPFEVIALPDNEQAAVAFLKEHTLLRVLSLHSTPPYFGKEDAAAWERFLKTHADSLFAPYAKAKLGNWLFETSRIRKPPDEQCSRGISLLLEAASVQDFLEAPDALFELIDDREPEIGETRAGRILETWPRSTMAIDAQIFLDRMARIRARSEGADIP